MAKEVYRSFEGKLDVDCRDGYIILELKDFWEIRFLTVDGSDDMRDNIKDGKALATALQQIDQITRNAVTQANDYLTKGTTGLEEKQLVDCVVITKDNADKLANFVYTE